MSIQEAANALRERLRHAPWLTAVGVAASADTPCIYLYVNSLRNAEVAFLKDGWQGYPVEVRKMGAIRSGGDAAAG